MIHKVRAAWSRLRKHFWLSLGFDVLAILVILLVVHSWQTRNLPINEPAPAIVLRQLETSEIISALQAGETGVVYFFAPWCFYCRHSIANLDGLVESDRVSWATAIALSYSSESEVAEFVEETGIRMPVLMGTEATAEDWAVSAFPTYYVIDADGDISSRSVGYSTWLGMWFRTLFA